MSEIRAKKEYSVKDVILLVIILFFPAILLQFVSMVMMLLLLATLIGVLLLAVVGVAELIVGLVLVGVGIEKLFSMPMGAFSIMGFGIANIGMALLMECLVLWLYGVAIPSLFKRITGKEEKDEKVS